MDYYDGYDDDYELFEDESEILQYRPPRYRPRYPRYRRPTYPCPRGTTAYYARYGDTIYRIARAYGIGPYDIIRANPNIEQRPLYAGQRICIPIRRR